MSWITRCPACGVTYKVVADQLRVAQGWLRCGQCQQAFDSTGLVVPWPVESHKTASTVSTDMAQDRLDIEDLLQHEDKSHLQSPLAAFENALSTFKPVPARPANTASTPEVFGVPMGALLASDPSAEEQAPPLAPAAVSSWPRVFVGMLMLALVLQWVWLGRHSLMVAQPSLAQPLQAACRLLGCQMVPPPLRDGVVIESSSLMPRDGGLELIWSVRNVTAQALEMPAMELTWLDGQNTVLVRRVIPPTEQLAPPVLSAGQIWRGQLQLLPAEGIQPVGYRLLNFYP
jgi:predicted Zn finger-like uncharacterized protein